MKWLKWIRPLKSLKTYFAQIGDGIIKPILNQYIIKKLNKYLTFSPPLELTDSNQWEELI